MSIYQKASLVQIPSGYKAADDKLYSVVPSNGDGDFTVTVAADATRVNKDGLIESVAADQARLNYDPTNPQDPHLLLEPSRTNVITQSQELTSGSLAKVSLTVADNTSIVDPQGNTNTKTLTATSSNQPRLEWRGTAVPASNTSYAMSFWVRYNTARYVAIAHFSQTGEYAIFDLVDGEVENDVGTQTAKIEAYKNGWYRVSKSFEVPSTASINYWKFTLCTQTAPFTGVSGEKADVFGLQLEAGSYPTSYIPTSGLAETRTLDKCLNAGSSNLFNDTEGTLFFDLENFSGNTREITLSNGFTSNRVAFLFYGSTNKLRFFVASGTTQVDSVFTVNYNFNQRNKVAFRYKQNDFKAYINGTQVFSTASGNTPVGLSRFDFANSNGTANFIEGEINQAMVFNEALSDSELQTLTS